MVENRVDRLGFKLPGSLVQNNVFLPRYYDPETTKRIYALRKTHDLVIFGDLAEKDHLRLATGNEIGKMAYGTGTIPFIRTSDISNWEIKTDPKQGVSLDLYDQYKAKQDVKAGDILFVRDGTYLIGQSCIVTNEDLPLLFQSHIFRIRLTDSCPISPYLFFAAINTPIVKKQIKSKQFTADIIDTIGNRIHELILPIPKAREVKKEIERGVKRVLVNRQRLRTSIKEIPFLAEGKKVGKSTSRFNEDEMEQVAGNLGYVLRVNQIKKNILIPKYYDTVLRKDIEALAKTHQLRVLSDLIEDGIVSWESGIEVGKMAYGTGVIPFIRTSDISNWELKTDPKQSVSEEIYLQNQQDVRANDILIVSDGTYLIGTSCMITKYETKILFSGGVDKLRIERVSEIDPFLFFALLNTGIVKRQIRSKQFTRDIIDTLSRRILELVIPIPKDDGCRKKIVSLSRAVVQKRVALRLEASELIQNMEKRK